MKSTQQFRDDQKILLAIRHGGIQKERCMNHLFEQYHGLVLRGQRRYKLSLTQAKEVYLDSLLALTSAVEQNKFKGESKITTYLYRIFENRCKNKVRYNMRREAKFEWVNEIPNLSDNARDMLAELILNEEVDWLKKLMNETGEKCREIIMMSEFLGYSLEEIGQRVAMNSKGAVATTKYRCMQKLKALIAKRTAKAISHTK